MLLDALEASGEVEVVALLDSDVALAGSRVLGVPVRGDDARLAELSREGVTHFFVGVGTPSSLRRALFDRGLRHGLEPLRVRHPSASFSRHADSGRGTQVLAAAVVNAGARLGDGVIVNSAAVVEHDCRIGDHAHVATGARLGGGVQVGEGAHLGIGAVLREGVRVGARSLVAAGAVVVADVPPDVCVAGVPARLLERAA